MDKLQNLEAFVTVAASGSFSAAARQLRVAKSVVTTRVQQLEEYVGSPLFHRNTRSVRLTELGETYLGDCVNLLGQSGALLDAMRQRRSSPDGRVRIRALPGFALGHMSDYLSQFQQLHPNIVVDLVVSDSIVDPVKEGFDCTLQIFSPASEELIARKLFPVRRMFCASPTYLEKHGFPSSPRELRSHKLGLYSGYQTRDHWEFFSVGEVLPLYLKPAMLTNSVHFLAEYGCTGAAIVCLPTLVASPLLLEGKLVPVLTDWQLSAFWLSAIYPRTSRSDLKLKLFIDYLVSRLDAEPQWDAPLIERGWLTRVPVQLV